jgi:hypothetical protein
MTQGGRLATPYGVEMKLAVNLPGPIPFAAPLPISPRQNDTCQLGTLNPPFLLNCREYVRTIWGCTGFSRFFRHLLTFKNIFFRIRWTQTRARPIFAFFARYASASASRSSQSAIRNRKSEMNLALIFSLKPYMHHVSLIQHPKPPQNAIFSKIASQITRVNSPQPGLTRLNSHTKNKKISRVHFLGRNLPLARVGRAYSLAASQLGTWDSDLGFRTSLGNSSLGTWVFPTGVSRLIMRTTNYA